MKILLWHGYLLRGSGSNIYTANIARVWRNEGHDVLLMCQEGHPEHFDFIDEDGDFAIDNSSFETRPTGSTPGRGRCRLVRPAIGDLLPVYVYDAYEGFTVKTFVDLTDRELKHYTRTNVEAMVAAIESFSPDAIITGHEVMGPYIAREACERTGRTFIAKLHGSALEYAVKRQERYLTYAQTGLGAARTVTGGSNYMIGEAGRVIPEILERAAVVNPGSDVDIFKTVERERPARAVVGYVGKFIPQKGVHNLLASLGLTTQPLEVVVVGYGSLEDRLHGLWGSLHSNDLTGALSYARNGDAGPLVDVERFLESGDATTAYFERAGNISVAWPGRLEHGPLSEILPTWDLLIVPSVLPEAFGMVAAEAAMCSVLPVVPAHSGIGEVGSAIEDVLGHPGLLTFDPGDPIRSLAQKVDSLLAIPFPERREMGRAAAALATARWSWNEVARQLLQHASGGRG